MEVRRDYHSNGQKFLEIEYKFGKANGMCRNWNEAGVMTMEGEYRDRNEVGIWKNWYDNGRPFVETLWDNGVVKALQSYHHTGGKEWSGRYTIKLRKDGQWQRYHENGQLHILASFNNGSCSGIWRIWDQNGNEQAPEIHTGGKGVDWDENGMPFLRNIDPAKKCPHKSCEIIW